MTLEELLAGWLPAQRWFASKSAPVDALELRSLGRPVDTAELVVDALVVQVEAAGRRIPYFVPLALRRGRDDVDAGPARIGEAEGWVVTDAARDRAVNEVWLRLVAEQRPVGELSPGCSAALSVEPGVPLGAEQSNTSLVHGDLIVKLFRRLTASPNPDLDVTRRLGGLGSTHVAPALGWLEGGGWTLAIVQPFLRGSSEGWALALTSVRDLYDTRDATAPAAGGDFAPEARRLGGVTAGLHGELARAYGVGEEQPASAAAQMRDRLEAAAAAVPVLAPMAAAAGACYDAVERLDRPVATQRVHGDYHLGQVLRTSDRWVVLDFEGEPARPLEERTALMSPLRDVAGMLRSFDYAAGHLRAGHDPSPLLDLREREWAERNRDAFCAGYAEAAGRDPREDAVLLRAYELDKAVYEVRYEADHRPGWVGLPLGAVRRLARAAAAPS